MKKDNKTLSGKKQNKKKDIEKINSWLGTMNIKDESNTLALVLLEGIKKKQRCMIANKQKNKHINIQKEYLKAVKGYFKSSFFRIL